MSESSQDVGGLLQHLFRHSAGRIVSSLTRRLGSHRLDVAEEAVQEALVRAMQTWPHKGVPDEPAAWLYRVAWNRAMDLLRGDAQVRALAGKMNTDSSTPAEWDPPGLMDDDELAMMFMCCHPDLALPARIALTLKTVSGFGVNEIASALLSQPVAISQRLVRAKRQLRDTGVAIEIPGEAALPERLDTVLDVIYLLFNEGYSAHDGDALTRADLCDEAMRLTRMLVASPITGLPHVQALLALMLLQASRLPAREDAAGDLILLGQQDRSRWDHQKIAEGLALLDNATTGDRLTAFHVEAHIAACHAAAATAEDTPWAQVLALYDDLLAIKPSPVIAMNRAIALAMAEDLPSGIATLEQLWHEDQLPDYAPLPAALGDLWSKAGDATQAASYYRKALESGGSQPQRRFLERRLAECTGPCRAPGGIESAGDW
jgi:RNA polymerase sigma-70 factor (ECF subfamily)